ncbi:hypothetical protein I302_108522 [Kwoniella bestiolae CBS 10118]|uniref:BRCT domain-containing protein n=1 Tax=Kwoniella bestiolae CBS 10118 TaxID=1296100 RepID=A0A1B9FVG0_9TREE|nr:hypothetical protein I302_07104 [Kwoniella bestiolae CBS 10118]OCF22763.1 hypothetical protein I302_07104 [Kwoniella bestiolae CBS 10118]
MSHSPPTLFKGLTFYIQPFCKMSQDSQSEVKQREDLMRVVRGYGGQISFSPTHPAVSHIIITSLKPFPKNEIITIKRRTDSYTYPRPPPVRMLDEHGWAAFRLVEDFGGVLIPTRFSGPSSSGRDDGTGHREEERWDGRRVVLKEDWLFDCKEEEMVLGEYQDWNGWRVRARYEDAASPSHLDRSFSNRPVDAQPLRAITWYTPSEFDNRPTQLHNRGKTSNSVLSCHPVDPPQHTRSTSYESLLTGRHDGLEIPKPAPKHILPPDPKVPCRGTFPSSTQQRSSISPLILQSPNQDPLEGRCESHSDSDLDCLNSDPDDQESGRDEIDTAVIGKKRPLVISRMRFKKHRKTEISKTMPNPLRLDQLPSYSPCSTQIPPTPISASRATDPSTALADNFVLDSNKNVLSTRCAKPIGIDAWTIIAQEIVDHPKEGIQSVCKRLAEKYEGRTWTGWKSLHWRDRGEIEELQKVMKGM